MRGNWGGYGRLGVEEAMNRLEVAADQCRHVLLTFTYAVQMLDVQPRRKNQNHHVERRQARVA